MKPKKRPRTDDGRIVRAVTIPVGAPLNMEWKELNAALAACWKQGTDAANWCIQQLFHRDTPNVAETPDAVKMGSLKNGRFYGYGEAAKQPWFADWKGGKQSLNIVLQYAHREYLKRRWDVMVRHVQSLLMVRYPYPYPLDADAWSLSYVDGGFPVLTCSLPGLDKPVQLRLKRRADFGRQLALLKQLHAVQGQTDSPKLAKRGEAALYRNAKGDLLVKVVGKFPKRERSDADKVNACLLHTDPNALLVAEINGRKPWILNCDQLVRLRANAAAMAHRWQEKHGVYRQRVGEDLKREKRMDPQQRANLEAARELRCKKNNNRIATAIHQVSAQVVRFCERQKVCTVAYDDSIRSFIPDGFDWHQLKEKLTYKLAALGIDLIARTSGEVVNEMTESRLGECGRC